MNIVKFKDTVLSSSDVLSEEKIKLFNTKFKARYAHCINWTYCVSFDDVPTMSLARELSQDPSKIENYDYLRWNDVQDDLVDALLTEKINSFDNYIQFNKFTPDDDITEDELKQFRTWLATNLYKTLSDLDDNTKHMLQFYMNHMSDDVLKYLKMFGSTTTQILTTSTSSCGCGTVSASVIQATVGSSSGCDCQSADLSSLYSQSLTTCDPLFIYKRNIYTKMVETFSDIDFWLKVAPQLIQEFKKYIDNIVKKNFSLTQTQYNIDYSECGCVSEKDTLQKTQINRLKALSTALSYIYEELDGDDDTEGISGHKNEIRQALNEWAAYLYEVMEW